MTIPHYHSHFVLTFSCLDRPAIVTKITGFLAEKDCNITESAQFCDPENGRFFMRIGFCAPADCAQSRLEQAFIPLACQFEEAEWQFYADSYRLRVMICVSHKGHCLNDLLYRYSIGTLPMNLICVVSNHTTWQRRTEHDNIAYYHYPVTPETKPQQEEKIFTLIEKERIDLVILARYMQIFSPFLTDRLQGRIINIHHSFLPSFKGAKPYFQAYQRGVKLIGATAHYVTQDLDEGPIITQGVSPVTHADSVDDLTRLGEDNESHVLARAVKIHLEHRVFINGQKTVVFQ